MGEDSDEVDGPRVAMVGVGVAIAVMVWCSILAILGDVLRFDKLRYSTIAKYVKRKLASSRTPRELYVSSPQAITCSRVIFVRRIRAEDPQTRCLEGQHLVVVGLWIRLMVR